MDIRNLYGWFSGRKRGIRNKVVFLLLLIILCPQILFSKKSPDTDNILNNDGYYSNYDLQKKVIKRFGKLKKAMNINKQNLSPTVYKLLKNAFRLLNKKPNAIVIIKGKRFKLDCIGTIRAVYYSIGIDIAKYFHKYKGNGVSRFYYTLKDKETIHDAKIPSIGDIIFWDNTWDRNNDGIKLNDPLTHAAIVVKVDDDGTIHYVHENYVTGIVVERMNLYNPTTHKDISGKEINSAMYVNSSIKKHPKNWLSGDLFKSFGNVLKIEDSFK